MDEKPLSPFRPRSYSKFYNEVLHYIPRTEKEWNAWDNEELKKHMTWREFNTPGVLKFIKYMFLNTNDEGFMYDLIYGNSMY